MSGLSKSLSAAPFWGRLSVWVALCLMAHSLPLAAREPILNLPIDCTLGEDCYIQSFVDADPAPDAVADFQCGHASRDNHRGTDFALLTFEAMRAGVNVLSAAPGIVRGTRNGVPEAIYSIENAQDVEGRECGNGVAIDHGGGWSTQYCHLALDSLTVTTGDRVAKGTVLGQVGLSGKTTYPHLHLDVRHNKTVIDPFDPASDPLCGPSVDDLWQTDLLYQAGGLIRAGAAGQAPDYTRIKQGDYSALTLSATSKALILWAHFYQARKDDVVTFTLSGPNRFTFKRATTIEKTLEQSLQYAGKRLTRSTWATGRYDATIVMERDGVILDEASFILTVE